MNKNRSLEDVYQEALDSSEEFQAAYPQYAAKHPLKRAERDQVWRPALELAIQRVCQEFSSSWGIVDSPIEERFMAAIWASEGWGCTSNMEIIRSGDVVARRMAHEPECLHIETQAEVGKYRCDFLLTFVFDRVAVKVAVELDGHDFHEKTKAQAAHDKKRDLTVLRFTGSEVYADAGKCVFEALQLLSEKMRKAVAAR